MPALVCSLKAGKSSCPGKVSYKLLKLCQVRVTINQRAQQELSDPSGV